MDVITKLQGQHIVSVIGPAHILAENGYARKKLESRHRLIVKNADVATRDFTGLRR